MIITIMTDHISLHSTNNVLYDGSKHEGMVGMTEYTLCYCSSTGRQ